MSTYGDTRSQPEGREIDELRAEVERLKAEVARLEGVVEELADRNGLAMPSLAHHFARVVTERNEARDAVKAEREACAQLAEEWADGQDRVALLKQADAPCSAESHTERAIIGRHIAATIRARSS